MSTSVGEAVAVDVVIGDRELRVSLANGRRIVVPLSRFPRLAAAPAEDLARWRLIGHGEGIHWGRLDEDISIRALLRAL